MIRLTQALTLNFVRFHDERCGTHRFEKGTILDVIPDPFLSTGDTDEGTTAFIMPGLAQVVIPDHTWTLHPAVPVAANQQVSQEWFSIKQAAALTGLSSDHIRRSILGGALPCSNVGTADRPTYRMSRRDLNEWMEERKAGPKPPAKRRKAAPGPLPYSRHFRPSKYRDNPPATE